MSAGGRRTPHWSPGASVTSAVVRTRSSGAGSWPVRSRTVKVVSVPMSVPLQRADKALVTVVGLLSIVFVAIGAALNLLLWKLVIQPVRKLSALSDRVSLGELDAPAFVVKSKDEIGVLAGSFARMRKSLVHAMKLLDQ